MTYSRWATEEEVKEKLVPVNYDSEIKKSGIGLMYDDKTLYIKDDEAHSLIIGSTGSGKTQTCLLPQLRLAIKANESFILHDVKGEVYDKLIGELKKQKYNTIVINLADPSTGDNFNPLSLPYKLYKEGERDKSVDILENIGKYIFSEYNYDASRDPFWEASAMSLFVGLTIYLFENAKEDEINLSSISVISSEFSKLKEYVNTIDKSSLIYMYLSPVVLAPSETAGSILAVFKQKIKLLTSRESLSKMMSKTNFDIANIQNEKSAVFIISDNKSNSKTLIPMIIDECYNAVMNEKEHNRRLNIIIDEFEGLSAIKEFNTVLSFSRSINIKFSVFVKSLLELNNVYGVDNATLLRLCFGNIIYLLANDMYTLEEMSKLCGNVNIEGNIKPLISVEELKLLNMFEAVVLIPRSYPIKTKLLPDYVIDWKFDTTTYEIPKNDNENVKIYNI